MDNNGCYKCTDRKPHCHSNCERHKDWKAEREARQTAIRAERDREFEVASVGIAGRLKAMKRKGVKEL